MIPSASLVAGHAMSLLLPVLVKADTIRARRGIGVEVKSIGTGRSMKR